MTIVTPQVEGQSYIMSKPRGLRLHTWLITRTLRHDVLRPLARLNIFTVEVRGKEYLPETGGYIITANHPSQTDPPLLFGVIDRNVVFLAKAELWRVPVLGFFMRLMGHIPVDRGNRESGSKAQAMSVEVLCYGDDEGEDKGGVVVIHPEGGCTPDSGEMRTFKVGVYYLSLESGKPVYACGLKGTEGLKLARIWHMFLKKLRRHVVVNFGRDPLYAKDYDGPDEFLAELRSRIEYLKR